jgi:hypothetical protein
MREHINQTIILAFSGMLGFVLLILIAMVVAPLMRVATKIRARCLNYHPMRIMTPNEMEFFSRLEKAWPQGYIFPQVAMSALIQPTAIDRKKYMNDFRKISQKRVDYAIFTAAMHLVCIVELDDATHDPAKDAIRDGMLMDAGIPTVRWHSKRKPSVPQIQKKLLAMY